ncbi:stage V sporulation protein D [Paenalkalicoccus suaedae]|uniref:serine-type D-Ala-D-Ala carboxypeptidase n=1 Tax=Paenalkalicoccus suaedae TaxID=2592382 RepID=A0A859FEL1_9BACI|nr:stage V sporulation protein D [Paenalkalicoccus suaedae]QKS71527.1 stage V sporulation protein D [Paenalkalicoccus suaedae]
MRQIPSRVRNNRLLFVLLIGCVMICALAIRLAYVQLVQSADITELASDLWGREIPFEGRRGDILDREGKLLATSITAQTLFAIPRQISDKEKTAEVLAPLLSMKEEEVYALLTQNESIVRMKQGARKMSAELASEIRKLQLEGIYLAEDYKRYYPEGAFLSHVLGFAGIDNQGLAGLELFYDSSLKGEKGNLSFYADAKGRRMEQMGDEYKSPKPGNNLVLTINKDIQQIVERELDQAEAAYSPDGAIAIAMNPKTGEILAMSSRPHFDPMHFQDVAPEIFNQNKPVWSQYEPGSTFKIITLAAALEEGLVDLERDRFYDPGYIEVAGSRLRCWKKGGHGSQTFLEVVQNSCNPGFVVLGERLGKEKLFSYIREFGFGSKTGIDLQGEGTGILFDEDKVGPLELATTAFGQGVAVTPLQQVVAVSAAVNGGNVMEPYLLKEWRDSNGTILIERKPTLKRNVISEKTSSEVRNALEHVVAKGTGKGAFVDGYRVGGKTGTAQKAKDGRYLENNHIVSFIGVAPMDDPEIVVYVAIDNPKNTVQFGGVVAAPIVGNIIEDSLITLDVPKRKDQIEKERTWLDPEETLVPDLIGRTKKELMEGHYQIKIEPRGDGNVVISQSPEPGSKIQATDTILIYMGDK